MFKFVRKALPGLFVVAALISGAWRFNPDAPTPTAAPGNTQGAAELQSAASVKLAGDLGKMPGIAQRIQELSSYKLNESALISGSIDEYSKDFIEDSVVSNTEELLVMKYALPRIKNGELKSLVQLMIVMHTNDLNMVMPVYEKLFGTKTVDLTHATVYPGTPDYDLGKRVENLNEKYLDKLKKSSGMSFDKRALDVLDSLHAEDVQSELAAQGQVQNTEAFLFTKHSADVTELHMMLMDHVNDTLYLHVQSSEDFQQDYTGPTGQSSNGKTVDQPTWWGEYTKGSFGDITGNK